MAALGSFEETQSLADPFREVNEKLGQAQQKRAAAELALAPCSAQVTLVDIELDALVLAFAEVVGQTDEKLHGTLFPKGVERVVEPVGRIQAEAVRRIVGQLKEEAAAASLRDPWVEAIGECLGRYDDAIAKRDEAAKALSAARDGETAARKAWLAAVQKHVDVIAEEFPDTDSTRAVFFPAPGAASN